MSPEGTPIPRPPRGPTDEELRERYYYHRPTTESAALHERVNAALFDVAKLLRDIVPPGREASIAQTKLQEVRFFANAGIALELGHRD
jgi:hypothetical protein